MPATDPRPPTHPPPARSRLCEDCRAYRSAKAAGHPAHRPPRPCCELGRLRWSRRESHTIRCALEHRDPALSRVHSVTIAVGGPNLKVGEVKAWRAAFRHELERFCRKTRTGALFVGCTELSPGRGKPHDHALLLADRPIGPVELRRVVLAALDRAGLDGRTAPRTSCTRARDVDDWLEYMFKIGRFRGKAGPTIRGRLRTTWGQTRTLYRPLVAVSTRGKRLRFKRAAAAIAQNRASPEARATFPTGTRRPRPGRPSRGRSS